MTKWICVLIEILCKLVRVISLLSQLIILTFLFSLYMANRKRGDEINLQNFLLPFPILLLLLLFIFFKFIVC